MSKSGSTLVRTGLLAPAVGWLAVFFLLPLGVVVRYGFAERGTYGSVIYSWVTTNFTQAVQPIYLAIYWRSLWMAALTTLLCILLGYPVAYYIAVRANPKRKPLWLMLTVVPFWTSFLVRTFAWMFILRTEGLANTLLLNLGLINAPLPLLYNDFAVFVGLVYCELPFFILPLYASLEKLDLRLLEAASDLNAPPWRTFLRVTLPLSKPGLIAGSVLVFVPSLGCFITSDLLGGARSILIGNLIQNQFTQRNQPFGSAIALVLTAAVLAVTVAAVRAGAKLEEG